MATEKTTPNDAEHSLLTCTECGGHDYVVVTVVAGRRATEYTRVYQKVRWNGAQQKYEYEDYSEQDAYGDDYQRRYCAACLLEHNPKKPWEPWQ